MYDATILICAVIGTITAILMVLPLFGVDLRLRRRSDMSSEISTSPKGRREKRLWAAVALAIVSVVLSGASFYRLERPRIVEKIVEKPVEKLGEKFKYPPDFQHLEKVDCDDSAYSGKKFVNETVELDGKEFLNCNFVNVRLLFHGNQTFGVQHNIFDQSVVFATDNHAIGAYGEMLAVSRALGTPDKGITWGSDKETFWVKRAFPLGTMEPVGAPTQPTATKPSGKGRQESTQSPKASGPSQHRETVINAPQGIGISGGMVSNPTVNNFGLPDRHLLPEQKDAIIAALRGKVCKPTFGALINVEDAMKYAAEIRNAFRAGGCIVSDYMPTVSNSEGGWFGVKVIYHDETEHAEGEAVYTNPNSPEGIVFSALDRAHMDALAGDGTLLPPGEVLVVVGRQRK